MARTGTKSKGSKGGRRKHDDAALTEKVIALREKDKTWSEIGEKLGITPGKAQFLIMCSEVKPKDKIKFSSDEELAEQVVEARDEAGPKSSWGWIAARSGVSEAKIKRLYNEGGGTGPQNVASARAEANGGESTGTKTKGRKSGKAKGRKGRRKGKGRKNPSTTS